MYVFGQTIKDVDNFWYIIDNIDIFRDFQSWGHEIIAFSRVNLSSTEVGIKVKYIGLVNR